MSEPTDQEPTQGSLFSKARLQLTRLSLEGDMVGLFQQAAAISSQALQVARVGVWLFNPSSGQLECCGHLDLMGAEHPAPVPLASIPTYLAAVKEQRLIATRDARAEPSMQELLPYLGRWKITSLLDAAVYRNGVVVGVVRHEHVGPPREWTKAEKQFAGTVADLVSNFLEVRERVAAQERAHELELKLKDAHRLDALGRMAAGIAHDLNNMLGVMANCIAILREDSPSETVEDLAQSMSHSTALVSQLLALSRKEPPAALVQPLDPLLSSFERLSAANLRPGCRVVFDTEKGLQVWADGAQLTQVLQNLTNNALEAMPKGGAVVIRAHARDDAVLFEVIDTGVGVPAENMERLFDPFFTTRPEGHGIGLAMVQQLVRQHHGEIEVRSRPGDGTTFRIWWPRAAPAALRLRAV